MIPNLKILTSFIVRLNIEQGVRTVLGVFYIDGYGRMD